MLLTTFTQDSKVKGYNFIKDTVQNAEKHTAKGSTRKRKRGFKWIENRIVRSPQTDRFGKVISDDPFEICAQNTKGMNEMFPSLMYIHQNLTCNMHFEIEMKQNFNVILKCA